ncbi:AAA domain-containing protein [Streptomyces sp. NBC_00557]|uniref:AAA domain-containing protein n=1 Tax=Streptomyces sp. NBC_00557 TaxID=2975776 RepID=UPI002E81AD7D|nr:AAA domain-containing protein [Streptomyces sp. NBC_00557]WUC34736.1 AAA domain-containing protein [Streptomyces sp. NBC_00557]
MGWQEEVVSALDAWVAHEGVPAREPRWRPLGRAVRGRKPGEYVVDVRGSDFGTDQLQGDSLRLAGPDESGVDAGHSVLDVFKDGTALRVRVPEFADPIDPHLWMKPQPTGFLVKALWEGMAALTDAPLAHLMARGEAGTGRLAPTGPPQGLLLSGQEQAYRACTGEGLWLVWGPPGTGKTTVLKRAIGDLIARGKRVLLVSATNIAVDNALWGVVKERRHADGEIVRVGPPHLREVAEDASVCLTLMVRERLAEADARRRAVAAQLVEARERARQLEELERSLTDFDPVAYAADRTRLDDPARTPEALKRARVEAHRDSQAARETVTQLEEAYQAAVEAVKATEQAQADWKSHDEHQAHLARLRSVVTDLEAKAFLADSERAAAQELLDGLEQLKGFAKRRTRRDRETARASLETARTAAREAEKKAADARSVLARQEAGITGRLAEIRARIPFSKQEITLRQTTLRRVENDLEQARRTHRTTAARLDPLVRELGLSQMAEDRVAAADRLGHPRRHALATALKPQVVADQESRPALERRHRELQEEYDKLARDAQGEIIRGAKLVATTLARFRTTRAVFEGEYDVVLVDEAGAATLPEVLLAVGKGKTTAVLLGDFMQLGPVLPKLDARKRPDVARWILREVYEHFGIESPAAAVNHPGCVVLDVQHRFGHDVMSLANALAYDGVLKPGPGVEQRAARRAPDDAEIVIIDTDGLQSLAQAHRTGRRKGWWPAGALLARALIDLHLEDGETAGVVTPYSVQAEATLEALRDHESTDGQVAEVGTAHRFQGREFPVVVFDTVEDDYGDGLWMSQATRAPGATTWARNGVRLFNVAVTRVQTRLYVLGSRTRILAAGEQTAMGKLAALIRDRRAKWVPATQLVAPGGQPDIPLGPFSTRLADVLSRHVEVTDVHDEISFYETFADRLAEARTSLWIWSPWTAKRLLSLLPVLEDAVRRGVRVTVFVRDPYDTGQKKQAQLVKQLRAVVPTVVSVNVMHQKIVVIDEHTVLLGSLNTLSQSRSREVMLTIKGGHFARKILTHEHAEDFAKPPRCGACKGDDVDLRRRGDGSWYWRCFNRACPARQGSRAWEAPVRFGSERRR